MASLFTGSLPDFCADVVERLNKLSVVEEEEIDEKGYY